MSVQPLICQECGRVKDSPGDPRLKIQVVSDLHVEFHRDDGQTLVEEIGGTEADVLVVAGDLAPAGRLAGALSKLCARGCPVVFVPGNHELYRASPRSLASVRLTIEKEQPNLHWLEEEIVEIRGQRFVGTPLWFAETSDWVLHRSSLCDFDYIRDFVPWVFAKNRASVHFLRKTVRQGDVVVTHHLPSPRSVPTRFSHSRLNTFFVCDVEDVIRERAPALWVHGHTHDSCDYAIGKTRVLCNPFGYVPSEVNGNFDARLVAVV